MRTALFLAIVFGVSGLLTRPSSGATGVPFEYRGGLILLQVQVAGAPAPCTFALDSGAGATVLDLGAARRLGSRLGRPETVQGVQGRCTAYRVLGLSATVSGVPLAATMLALDLARISQSCGTRVDGLLGLDFFRGRVVQIDYASHRLTFPDHGSEAPALPLATRNGALCLRVGVNGQEPQWMRLDTGCGSALEWVPGRAAAPAHGGTSVAATGGGARTLPVEVTLGPEQLRGVRAGVHAQPFFPGESGLVGNGLLGQFLVTIDASHGSLTLARRF